jgi:hypothetical protein
MIHANDLFWDNGTVIGIGYSDASSTRGAIISVVRKYKGRRFSTGFGVDGVDFNAAYDRAIDVLADFLEIADGDPMRAQMKDTKAAFLSVKGLTVKPVVIRYDQVMRK